MEVQAIQNLNAFPQPQPITNRNFTAMNQGISIPVSLQQINPKHIPLYKSPVKEECVLTCKRPRDQSDYANMNQFQSFSVPHKKIRNIPSEYASSLIGDDISLQIQQQHFEMDSLIAQHGNKVQSQVCEWPTQQMRYFSNAVQRKLKEKDESILQISRINFVLQERIKSLCVENEVWKDLAQANQATANSLRSNLEQVLAQVSEDRIQVADVEDCMSTCGSYGECSTENDCGGSESGAGICKKCGERESRVLVLPCRHLCLCTLCGSSLTTCPVCHSIMNASVHVIVA